MDLKNAYCRTVFLKGELDGNPLAAILWVVCGPLHLGLDSGP